MTTAGRRYAACAAMVVLAVALGAVFGLIASRAIGGYDIAALADPTGSTVTIGDRDVAVWVSPKDASTSCGAIDDDTGLQSFSSDLTTSMSITDGGRSWSRVFVIDGAPGSTHTLTCTAETDLAIGVADAPACCAMSSSESPWVARLCC